MAVIEADSHHPAVKEVANKNSDPRLMGALWLITRCQQGIEEILLVTDENKSEVSAGLSGRFTSSGEIRWGLMGGGRQEASNGRKETRTQTLLRELEEELQEVLLRAKMGLAPEAIESLYNSTFENAVQRTIYPFLVGQLVTTETAVTGVNEIAAAIDEIQIDSLPRELRTEIVKAVESWEAQWIPLPQLESAFDQAQMLQEGIEVGIQGIGIRPQVLTAAKIKAMNQEQDPAVVAFEVQRWNRQLKRYLQHTAKQHGVRVKNGAIGVWGMPKAGLAQSDYEFLNAQPLPKRKR